MKKFVLPIILIILLVGVYPAFSEMNTCESANAVKGTLNLKNYNFERNGSLNIQGQWEIYINKLLNPEQVKLQKANRYLNIPSKLTNQLNGKNTGYMTMHLKIFLPKGIVYGIRLESTLSASKIWVNGILQAQVGQVGKSYEEEKSIYLPSYLYFTAPNGVADIVIQTSNYRIIYPVLKSMKLGLKDKIMNMFIISASIDLIIVGGLFIIELISLCLYSKFKDNKSFLYFSVLCVFTQLRCLFLNERIIEHLFPNMPFELLSKTAAITYYLYIPIYVLFLKELFPDLPKKILKAALYFSIIFTIICTITNNTFYDRLGFLGEAALFIILLSLLIFLIKKVKCKEENSLISLTAFIVLVLASLNDILVSNGMIFGRYGFQVGMFIFVFLETYIIIRKYSNEIINIEKLKIEKQIIYERSIRDDLTGLYKRNYIDKVLDRAMVGYMEKDEKFSVIMFDIDYFKKINDNYGHLIGDDVLVVVSNIIKKNIRKTDYAGRYGGEEFIIIMPNTDEQVAKEIAEKIRINIDTYTWENGMKVTISGGIYENKVSMNSECIKNADNLLYEAKENGRNRIVG
ncbi:sensor domain-containing diguanylate cyclase [Clostridium hydrogenum]|uniref:sensor domain-containing diguanylate cyclase n=1 Tax=Clostridium hydrogenum TaxID=2855764 RepID=UPI001F30F747|nr:diguanylate cyclase [Clostridium hydrogenum]